MARGPGALVGAVRNCPDGGRYARAPPPGRNLLPRMDISREPQERVLAFGGTVTTDAFPSSAKTLCRLPDIPRSAHGPYSAPCRKGRR